MPTPIERTEALISAIAMLQVLSKHSHISKIMRAGIDQILQDLPTLEDLEKPEGLFQRVEPWIGGPLDVQPKGEGTIVNVWPPQYAWEHGRNAAAVKAIHGSRECQFCFRSRDDHDPTCRLHPIHWEGANRA